MKTAKGFALLAVFTLSLVIGLATSSNADPPQPAFTSVGVKSIVSTSGTQLFFRAQLSGFSPLSSGSVTVTWPGGSKVTTFSASELYYDQLGDGSYYRHSESMPNPLPNGDFVFRVSNSLGSDQETFTFTNNPVPVVSNASMTPANVTFTGTTTPAFTWSPVTISGKTTYYCVEIYDKQQNYAVYMSNRFSSVDPTVSFTVPSGKLLADVHYQWRVAACDDQNGLLEQNRSNSNFNNFYTGIQSVPEFAWTTFRSSNSSTGLQLQYGGQFKGTFPYQVTLCNSSSPANGINYNFQSGDILSETSGAYYWKSVTATNPQNDTVSLTIQTDQGSDTDTRAFTYTLVPIVDVSSIRVSGENLGNNAYIDSLTPTFSWSPVTIPGKTTYYRAQISDWIGRIMLYSTPRQTDASFTVPANVLQPESSYRLVIRPTDGGGANSEGNQSISNVYYFTTVNGEGPGTISGYVRQINGVTAIGGATVEALGTVNQQTTTASDGSYMLNLAAGNYRLRVSAPGYAREYYNNVTPSSEATLITVASESAQTINFDLNEGGSISGRLLQSDGVTPVPGAQVSVRPSLYFFDDGFYATTGPDGSYTVIGLALGQYKVRAEGSGYAKLRYYNNVYGWNNAALVSVTPPQNTPNIDIRLDPAGVIQGFVRAGDGITPIQVGIIVDPPAGAFEGIGATSSATDGNFRIEGLPPSNYTVRIGDNSIPGWYAGEFYNSKQTWPTADWVAVAAGATVSGINFTLDEGGAVTGTVYDAATFQPISGIQLGAFQAANGLLTTPLPVTGANGTFRINLLPGSYKIRATSGGSYISEWFGGVQNINAATAVTVNFKQITSGIDIYLDRPGSISGTVFEENDTTPISGASVFAFPVDAGILGNGKNTGPDGTYTINGLMPGNYAVFVTATGHVSASRPATVAGTANTPNINFSLETYPYTVNIIGQGVVGTAGGTVGVTDPNSPIAKAGVVVTANALGENSVITIGQVNDAPPLPPGTGALGSVIHFGPEGLTFSTAVTLKIPYTDQDLAAAGVTDPLDLDVYTFNTAANEWQIVEDQIDVDEVNKLILVYVNHFSIYRLGYNLPLCFGQLDADTDVDGSDLWDYIADGSFADIGSFAASFGRTNCP